MTIYLGQTTWLSFETLDDHLTLLRKAWTKFSKIGLRRERRSAYSHSNLLRSWVTRQLLEEYHQWRKESSATECSKTNQRLQSSGIPSRSGDAEKIWSKEWVCEVMKRMTINLELPLIAETDASKSALWVPVVQRFLVKMAERRSTWFGRSTIWTVLLCVACLWSEKWIPWLDIEELRGRDL